MPIFDLLTSGIRPSEVRFCKKKLYAQLANLLVVRAQFRDNRSSRLEVFVWKPPRRGKK